MKNKKLKQSLLALACVFTMMSASLSVRAEEAAWPEDAYLSVGITGNCGCSISTMDYLTVSRRTNTVNDGGKTHIAYNITYICPKGHGIQSTAKAVKGTHLSGPYVDSGHKKHEYILGLDVHIYKCYCSCGVVSEEVEVTCMASASAIGGHAIP